MRATGMALRCVSDDALRAGSREETHRGAANSERSFRQREAHGPAERGLRGRTHVDSGHGSNAPAARKEVFMARAAGNESSRGHRYRHILIALVGALLAASVTVVGLGVLAGPVSAASIAHAPVLSAAFREAVVIEATVDCASPECSGTLYFRTSTPGGPAPLEDYLSTPMTSVSPAGSSGHYVVAIRGQIPSSVVDTRGVDYMFAVTDGDTTSWFPGAPGSGWTRVSVDPVDVTVGTEEAPAPIHISVREPIRLVHDPVALSYVAEPIQVTATATCFTPTCSAELSYRTSTGLNTFEGTNQNVNDGLNGSGFTTVAMASRLVQDLGVGAGRVLEFTAEIPSSVVDTNGVDYFVRADDGYTKHFSPGTSYVSTSAPVDGTRAGWHHVEVFSRPLVAHVPPAYYVPGTALQLSAEVTSSTGFPTVTLRYRVGSDPGLLSLAMTVRETPIRRPEGTVYAVTGAIPGSVTARGGMMVYGLAVNDGHQTTYSPPTAGYVDSNTGYVVAVSMTTPL